LDIVGQRLRNQHLARPQFDRPGEVVAWLGAVQAQDYPGALWALGLRTRAAIESGIERAIADRTIVRTWPLRGTLHFVAPADVRWMLKYMTPRMVARAALRFRQLELDDRVFGRSTEVVADALQQRKQLTRDAIYERLESSRIATGNGRGLHILWKIAQDGVICFGAREGKQHTFALLDEWVRPGRTLERDEALAELARRYFASHGPATLQDFGWWSGLAAADARAGLEMARPRLRHETTGGKTYWCAASTSTARARAPMALLLPVYDEYTVGYQDRSAVLAATHASKAGHGIFNPPVIVDGRIVGTWTRARKKDTVVVEPRPFVKLGDTGMRAIEAAAERYRRFLS
jgi:DNA glycosylase AlkZ-like